MSIQERRCLGFWYLTLRLTKGITLCEIVTVQKPYWKFADNEILAEEIIGGLRMERPLEMSEDLWELTQSCWESASERFSFPRIVDKLRQLERDSEGRNSTTKPSTSIENFTDDYVTADINALPQGK